MSEDVRYSCCSRPWQRGRVVRDRAAHSSPGALLFPGEPYLVPAAGRAQARARGRATVTVTVPRERSRHQALLYRGHSEYLSAVRAFVQACAARGDAVFVAVPERKAQLVRQELGADSAHMTLADMADLGRNPARIIPAVLWLP